MIRRGKVWEWKVTRMKKKFQTNLEEFFSITRTVRYSSSGLVGNLALITMLRCM